MTVFLLGAILHVFAKLIARCSAGITTACIALSAVIVLVYILLGGLTSAIYMNVFAVLHDRAGLHAVGVPRRLKDIGGWSALKDNSCRGHHQGYAPAPGRIPGRTPRWHHRDPMGVEWFGVVVGLGFVLSFGYWCTDFLVVNARWPPKHERRAPHAVDRRRAENAVFPRL